MSWQNYVDLTNTANYEGCLAAAHTDGHTKQEAENCENGELKCKECPLTNFQKLKKKLSANKQYGMSGTPWRNLDEKQLKIINNAGYGITADKKEDSNKPKNPKEFLLYLAKINKSAKRCYHCGSGITVMNDEWTCANPDCGIIFYADIVEVITDLTLDELIFKSKELSPDTENASTMPPRRFAITKLTQIAMATMLNKLAKDMEKIANSEGDKVQELLEYSKKLQEDASTIIDETDFMEAFKKFAQDKAHQHYIIRLAEELKKTK